MGHHAHLPGTMLAKNALQKSSYMPTAIEEETEAQRGEVTYPLSHSLLAQSSPLKCRWFGLSTFDMMLAYWTSLFPFRSHKPLISEVRVTGFKGVWSSVRPV